MKQKIIYILLDAFRTDYVDPLITPFLHKCAKNGTYYKEVIPSLSFCERTEIFTGLKPDQSGMFTAIGYNPLKSPYRNLKFLLKFLNFLEQRVFYGQRKFRRALRILASKVFKKLGFSLSCYNIPFNILPYFSLTEDQFSFFDERAFSGAESIFSQCKENNIRIFYDAFTSLNASSLGSDKDRLELTLKNIDEDYDIYMVYISCADSLGHLHGPESLLLKNELKKLDQKLDDFCNSIIVKYPETKFIFNGDHGMSTVVSTFNIISVINDIKKKLKLDDSSFTYFIDSTIFRFWIQKGAEREQVLKEIRSNEDFNKFGRFVDEDFAGKHNLPLGNTLYGDLIWIAHEGVLIFPDFFHEKTPQKGMHGYIPDNKSGKGMCVLYGKDIPTHEEEKIELTEIYNILSKQLNLK